MGPALGSSRGRVLQRQRGAFSGHPTRFARFSVNRSRTLSPGNQFRVSGTGRADSSISMSSASDGHCASVDSLQFSHRNTLRLSPPT